MLTVAIDAAMSEGLAALGREIAEALERTGTIRAVVVRSSQDDETDGRVLGAARGAGADVLLLLDPAQAEGLAAGGTAIPPEAAGQGDEVALVLTELARRETVPQAARLVAALSDGGVGAVAVAEVPDIVTVLVGPDDAGEAQGAGTGWAGTPDERREVIARIAAALGEWATGEAVQGDLLRQ
jgi:N-acetylmuramoyl-L-alanine amidase